MKTMKTIKTSCALLGITTVMATSNLMAGIDYGDTGSFNYISGSGPGGGGPFKVSAAGIGTFQTFCLELNEYLLPSSQYTVNFAAVNGGIGGGNPDPISIGTAYIYSQFIHGAAGYTVGSVVQQAIWWLEDETAVENGFSYGDFSIAKSVLDQAITDLGYTAGDYADLKADASKGAYGVVVLNLTDNAGNLRQDVLASVPEPSTVVAGALLLLPFGISTLRIMRKSKA